jgi:protocatechuate 3,4-dioxygenase beta subunit
VNSGTYKPRLPIALLLFFTAVSIGNAAPLPDTASVHGTVTNAASGEGLRKAYLRLAPVAGKGDGYAAVTNDQGTFEMEKIEPGSYRLSAECVGFLDAENAGMELRLSAGDSVTGIEIKLVPQAVLSGRVLDEDGDPWPNANIALYHSVWSKGRRHLEFASSSEVDDRGEFRISGLSPGRYYVQAEPDRMWEQQHHPDVNGQPAMRQQPTWYPSAPDVESAAPITVAAGQQFAGLDLRLRRGVGSKLRITGKLTGLQDIPAPVGDPRWAGRGISAQRVPSVTSEDGRSGTIQPDGSFEIDGVSHGTYDVRVRQGFPWMVLGHAKVQVDDRDVENVAVELHPPQNLRVTVRVDDGAAKPPRDAVYLEYVEPGIEPFVDDKGDGSLEIENLGLGLYQVFVKDSARKQVYLKTLRYGNAESNDGTFTLSSYGVPLELTLSTRGAKLSGTVTGKAAMPKVILIPDTADIARREYATRTALFDQNGVFTIEAIAPGSYKLYAFENVPEGTWLDPEFLKEVESSGTPFEFAEGDAKTVQAPLLPKTETDRVLAKLGID